MKKYLCIHGHFYQPPRENPWLEAIELQDSASPYHDWNERITSECYAPNAAARILDAEGRIERIVNNYSKISFNFGPTLLAWMAEKAPEVLLAIIEADRLSRERYSGHGSAIAQVYSHAILPLANRADKYTQVFWGMQEFEHRFGRPPEGMWLPEMAVNAESLEVLAEMGIRFTVLSPFQARGTCPLDTQEWSDVSGGQIDPTRAYLVKLESGRTINVFFYDASLAQAVAFEQLLSNGEHFATRLSSVFSEERNWDQLVHIATDGESYGHHHWQGEMALAYALHHIEATQQAQLTNYGEFLERCPPTHEVQLHENSSWSCAHGIERWRKNCGCNSGKFPAWHQKWRQPLREAFDWLRDHLAARFETHGKKLFRDPWETRNQYIRVILNRSPDNVGQFLQQHAAHPLDNEEPMAALKLLEMQRHVLLMFTSCAWFFDEISGLETVQTIQYACRAIQLALEVTREDFEPGFLEILAKARSNVREHRDGALIYEKFARTARVGLEKVTSHYAISSLFEDYPEQVRIHTYNFAREHYQVFTAGQTRLVLGRTRVASEITGEASRFSFGVLHLGEHNLNCGVRPYQGEEALEAFQREIAEIFGKAEFPEIIRAMDRYFGETSYSLKSLFRDEQRKILYQILNSTHTDLENRLRLMMDRYTPLMRFLAGLGVPAPSTLQHAAHYLLNADLRQQFEKEDMNLDQVRHLLEESAASQVPLDAPNLSYALERTIHRLIERCACSPEDTAGWERLAAIAAIARSLPFEVNLWKTQNVYHALLHSVFLGYWEKDKAGDEQARTWVIHFTNLGEQLGLRKMEQ